MKNSKQIVIRVGEKNNFNQTEAEFIELEKYKEKGLIFTNSNAFNPIDSRLPSIITINPYMKFAPLTGDLSNVKAVRIKIYSTGNDSDCIEMEKCIKFCCDNNLKMLLTYMRYRSIKTATQYSGENFRLWYEHKSGYFRATKKTKESLLDWVKMEVEFNRGNINNIYECDSKELGCPGCMNCTKLTFGLDFDQCQIKALNLSMSGVNDPYGNKGLCKYNCPDCFAKLVTFGKRPQCDKLITNRKMTGDLNKKRKITKCKI